MDEISRSFLDDVFGAMPTGHYYLIWHLIGRHSSWFTNTAMGAYYVQKNQSLDTYCGVALATQDYGPQQRCTIANAAGIVGLWADIDFADPAHATRKTYPPDQSSAEEMVGSLDNAPSITVHSGHGLQCWWLFKEPWIFETGKEREAAQTLARRWLALLRATAQTRGWDIDSTADLARVLRVPGTTNCKGDPVPVTLLARSDVRYNPSDLTEFLDACHIEVESPANGTSNGTYHPPPDGVHSFTLEATATPNADKWALLIAIEPRATLSWERKRKDLADQSASGYDLSLAAYTVMAGWTDQEIVDLLIAGRRHNGDDLKLRYDYYARVLDKARSSHTKVAANDALDRPDDAPDPVTPEDIAAQRVENLRNISSLFEIEVQEIRRYTGGHDDPQYQLVTSKGEITLGPVDHLIEPRLLRNKVAAIAGHYMPTFTPRQWPRIAQALLNCCEDVDIGAEGTESGEMRAWLRQYLSARPPSPDDQELLANDVSYIAPDGIIYIVASAFKKWLSVQHGEKLTNKALGKRLRQVKATPHARNYDTPTGHTTRSVWQLPKEIG